MGRDQTHQRILDAATAEFAQKGYSGATTRGIATRAGVNELTLFRHFGSKDELMAAVLRSAPATIALSEGVIAQMNKLPPQEALLEFARHALEYLTERVPWLRVELVEPERTHQATSEHRFGIYALVADYFRGLQASGAMRPDTDPLVAADVFLAGIMGYVVHHRVMCPSEPTSKEEAFLRLLVQLFLPHPEVK